MASAHSRIFNFFLRLINKKTLLRRQFKKGNFNAFTSPLPTSGTLKVCRVDTCQVNNRNVFTLHPLKGTGKKRVLYIHGGAFVSNFTRLHWNFLSDLVTKTPCTVTTPDYPLAPEHTWREAMEMLISVYRMLLTTHHPDELVLMGDSAGAGLALALAQELKNGNLAQPSRIVLLSPWLDLTLSNPDIAAIDPIDPFTGVGGLRMAAKAFAGKEDPADPRLSPVYGSLQGLGKISVLIGTREILLADARKLRALMENKGLPLHYSEYADMIHVWMLLHFPESRKARQEIMDLIRE